MSSTEVAGSTLPIQEHAKDNQQNGHHHEADIEEGAEAAAVDISKQAPLLNPPNPVASANVGKDAKDTFEPSAPAPTTAERRDSPLLAGPILRYTHQSEGYSTWHGSCLVVLSREAKAVMRIDGQDIEPHLLLKEEGRIFYRFALKLAHHERERDVPYEIEIDGADKIERSMTLAGKGEAYNILFHSCNGFCSGANEQFEGPTLWRDVLRKHEKKRFHVLVGGGDQIYSDGVQLKGAPLEEWSSAKSERHRGQIKFTPELQNKVDAWYFQNHCDWFNTEPFRQAVAAVPSIQIWDDHDIIDGFGSYKDKWQRSPVFIGIGEIAWKYMCLFQQHINPNTVEDPDPLNPSGRASDTPHYIDEPSYIVHPRPGPYIRHRGISMSSTFGPEIAFIGFDCRTDRTQKRICYEDSYDAIFNRMEKDIVTGQTKHVLVMLGVPIAYPRLTWLEDAISSPHLVKPLRAIHKVTGIFGGLFNTFDGAVELLDDLQDHWACGLHKKERNALILRLQAFAKSKNVRITILSGDVHLAAVGRFFSKKSLNVPQELDHRYITNIISSAITNAPPPAAVAQVLNQRNKLHHLDHSTDENLMKIWNVSTDNSNRLNQTTYPARNYCIIQLLTSDSAPPLQAADQTGEIVTGDKVKKLETEAKQLLRAKKVRGTAVDEKLDLRNESGAVTHGTGGLGALSISIQIEIDAKSSEGLTKSYGFAIPMLRSK